MVFQQLAHARASHGGGMESGYESGNGVKINNKGVL
jgi:hypothetical protein